MRAPRRPGEFKLMGSMGKTKWFRIIDRSSAHLTVVRARDGETRSLPPARADAAERRQACESER